MTRKRTLANALPTETDLPTRLGKVGFFVFGVETSQQLGREAGGDLRIFSREESAR